MQSVPAHDVLTAAIGRTFVLGNARGQFVEAQLVAAPVGIPMDDSYVCYAAIFELPAGIHLPQDTYRITAPGGAMWELLATPTRPSAAGRATLTAVLHCLRVEGAGNGTGESSRHVA